MTAGPCELDGPEQLETVILLLLSDPDKSAHRPAHSLRPGMEREFGSAPGTEMLETGAV